MSGLSTVRDIARVDVELTSPLAIGTGGSRDDLLDAELVVDLGGLPVIPGTSLAGVLRAAWRAKHSAEEAARIFGSTPRPGSDGVDSSVVVSFGHLHDSRGRPAPARTSDERLADPLLRAARVPIVRNHVRIGARGAADGRGLFDECLVGRGHRFRFELEVRDQGAEVLEELLGLLASGRVRLGGKTRRGLGGLKIVEAWRRRFDLKRADDLRLLGMLPVDVAAVVPAGVLPRFSLAEGVAGGLRATLALRARSSWIIGGGVPLADDTRERVKSGRGEEVERYESVAPDMVPYREPRVLWRDGVGRLDREGAKELLPATSLKGVLRHRTAYHLNAMELREGGRFAEDMESKELEALDAHRHEGLRSLFGWVDTNARSQEGEAGRVFIEDAYPPGKVPHGFQDHVSLDRFTQGPLMGHLFDERPCFGGDFRVQVHVEDPKGAVPPVVRKAFQRALEDLTCGRLRIGGGAGRGHGWFEDSGSLEWSDGGAWVAGGKP